MLLCLIISTIIALTASCASVAATDEFPRKLVMSSASRTRHLPRFNHTPFEGRRHPYAGRPIACMCPASSATALAIVCLRKTWHLRPHGGAEHSVARALSGSAVSTLQCSRYVAAPFVASLLGHQPRRLRAGLPRPVHPGFRLASHLLEAPDNATGASRASPRVGLAPTGCMALRAAPQTLLDYPIIRPP